MEKIHDNIVKLRALTETLKFAQTIRTPEAPQTIHFDVTEGTGYGVGLYSEDDNISVMRCYFSKGTKYPEHHHPEWEFVLVYKGELHLIVDGKKRILPEKGFYYLNPGQRHSGYFPQETKLICLTIPRSEDFPRGG